MSDFRTGPTLRELIYERIEHLAYPNQDGSYSSNRWGNCQRYLYDVALGLDSSTKLGKKEVRLIDITEPKLLDMLSDDEFLNYYQSIVTSAFRQM